jgi:acyl-CoA reductase-like NAD-dependent aldehyde dehydrogenase
MSETISLADVRRGLTGTQSLLVNGRRVSSRSGRTIDIVNPATEETFARVSEGGASDVDMAVAAARASFESASWRGMPADQRTRILWRIGELIEQRVEEMAYLQTLENGMPFTVAKRSVLGAAGWLRAFSGVIKRIGGRAHSSSISAPGEWHAYTRREPVGVVGLITPWNGPLSTLVIKAAPALAAGCSCVAKPSELTPLTSLKLGELALEAGLPPGVLNVVPGYGHDAGKALAAHPLVSKISFTGSTAVGKELVRLSAGNLKRVTLELGGKSPCVVFADADMDIAIPGAAMAIFANSGQACIAGSRLFVEARVFDRVVSGIAEIARSLKVGDGLEPDTQLGPLISQKQRDRVTKYIESGRAEGAELVAGGHSRPGRGFFVEPTVFTRTRPDMLMVREEIFGPVLSASPFDDLDQLPALVNATQYALAAGIYTTNVNHAHRLASRMEAGSVYINCYSMFDACMPFGGFKESGWGRELGEEGLDAYLESKSVWLKLQS